MRKPIHLSLGKGMRSHLWILLYLCSFHLLAQPCPSLINCPQSTPTYCDESTNDPFLWNDAPFTVSNTIGGNDMHEGAIDLNLKVKGCNGGGITSISYILYLDLDNDNIQETVLMSANPPVAGRVQANNYFNPGYSGGDTVVFDRRVLPDSMLYRFRLEIAYYGDTTTAWVRFSTDADPYHYVPVILPEGRHRIEWRAVQDGVERFCDRNFKVKDCKKPLVTCKTGLAVYLDVTQTATLNLAQALLSTSDNITPDTQLVVGMRRVGTGFGFPMDAQGNPQDTAMFSCENNENQFIEIWSQDKSGNLENCTAAVLVYDTAGFCPFSPFPSICARTCWNDEIIRDVQFSTSWTIPGQAPIVNQLEKTQFDCSELTSLPPTSLFTLRADKDTFPLNGVTTFDLVLISKHILAITPLDAGWKLAAADANMSNSITTFDILELRKLILGLSNQMPNNVPSWRFFADTCTVWGSPFFGYCPTAYTLPVIPISNYPPNLPFTGLKVGDVNGTASVIDSIHGSAESRGDAVVLEWPDISMQAGETREISLQTSASGTWNGFQFSMQYDPAMMDLVPASSAENISLGADNWSKSLDGRLNLSCSDAFAKVFVPGEPLIRVLITAKQDLRLSDALQLAKKARIAPEIYDGEGLVHEISWRFVPLEQASTQTQAQIFDPAPNPSSGTCNIPVRLTTTELVSTEIYDLSGQLLWRQQNVQSAGAHILDIPALALPNSGVYLWRVCAGDLVKSGRLVRI